MAKKPKIEAPENKTLGILMNNRANEIARVIDPLISDELEELSNHREEWEGGRFVVMHKITSNMTPEQIDTLPDPHAKTGNNPAHYLVEKFRDGKSAGWKEVYFYDQLALDLPGVIAMGKRIDQLKRSMQDPAKVFTGDISKDIFDMTPDYREALIKKLERRIANAKANVKGAFELRAQLLKFQELKHVECELIFALGPDGMPLDGNDGRAFQIEATQVPIVVKSTVKGRTDIDKVHVSVGTFLKYDIDTAKDNGGTYQALLNTVKREKPSDEQGPGQQQPTAAAPQAINTVDTALARLLDVHEFFDRAWLEKSRATIEALKKATHGPGSDDAFLTCYQLKEMLVDLVGSPQDQVRAQALIQEQNKSAA